jgi:Rifampin ADP-ribosyl transferase/Protein of unknown function (DUF664)
VTDELSPLGDEWWWFLVDRHLDRMLAIVDELGDELANVQPALPGANTAFQIVFHCCGMLEWWTREAILGIDVGRDRDAEFAASGSVGELRTRADVVRRQLRDDLAVIDLDGPLLGDPSDHYKDTAIGGSPRGVLLHVLEELAQHHGHLELTRDVLRNTEHAAPADERGVHVPVTYDSCGSVRGPFFHGTKSRLALGDQLVAGMPSNFQQGRVSNNIYFTALVETAAWGAELATALSQSEGRGHIYVVEPLGPFEDDPNVTNKRFPGNPTQSYRTRHPLRVIGEVGDWEGHEPDVLQAMLDGLAVLRERGLDVIED